MSGDSVGDFRADARAMWENAADGWGHQADWWDHRTRPVSEWLIEAIDPQPGMTVVEVGAGPGDVGLLAAEVIQPGGRVLITDGAEAMVATVKRRAKERGLTGIVEARTMETEWIDLSAATVDAMLGRWVYMLLADHDAALRETRRVLKPGGVLALAAWNIPEANPWNSVIGGLLSERGLTAFDPASPGPFTWNDRAVIGEHLGDAGFVDVVLDTVDFTFDYPDADAWWDTQIDLSPTLGGALTRMDPAARDELMEAAQARVADYVEPDGRLILPASTHVARAEA
jgi:SAM-dependent methyltransferase